MKTNVKKQRFLNWTSKVGWYLIDIAEPTAETNEVRTYLTPSGVVISLEVTEDSVVSIVSRKV